MGREENWFISFTWAFKAVATTEKESVWKIDLDRRTHRDTSFFLIQKHISRPSGIIEDKDIGAWTMQ